MTKYLLDQQIPKDKFKVLFNLTYSHHRADTPSCLRIRRSSPAIDAVQAQLQAAARNPPTDAVSA